MAKKHVLNLAFYHDFSTFGIFSSQKDYRMCWLLNNHLGIGMKRLPDFTHPADGSDKAAQYPVYHYHMASCFLDMYLIPGKTEESFLFKVPKNLDFLLLLKSSGDPYDASGMLQTIRKIPQVVACMEITPMPEKKASEFFFDFEMYLATI
jgi:hypothetical protein